MSVEYATLVGYNQTGLTEKGQKLKELNEIKEKLRIAREKKELADIQKEIDEAKKELEQIEKPKELFFTSEGFITGTLNIPQTIRNSFFQENGITPLLKTICHNADYCNCTNICSSLKK